MKLLEIKDLKVRVAGKTVLNGVNLVINKGEKHTIMGPNGGGKSTLAKAIMGHPDYEIIGGDILFKEKSVLKLSADKRAKLGIFLGFQHPVSIEGVKFSNLLFQMIKKKNPGESVFDFHKKTGEMSRKIGISAEYFDRDVNVEFSGGEKKKAEILQLMTANPEIAILDELDSGLDVDTMKTLAGAVSKMCSEGMSCIIITHYNRLLADLKTDFVHILKNGKIILSGGPEIAVEIEKKGYAGVKE